MKEGKKHWRLPALGQRIIKTAAAVFLCFIIYYLRGFRGSITDAVVAAIICIQPYTKDSKKSAISRVKGTLAGAFWGLAFLFLFDSMPHIKEHMLFVYLLMSIGIVIVLYTAVLFKMPDSASLTAIIFMCIIAKYPNVESPLIQTFDRVFDTTVGVMIASLINSFHLPRQKQENTVFFVRLRDLVEDRFSHVTPRVLIELNRLYDEGARICLESEWLPAFLISQMGMTNVNMPVIVMSGAAVYDIRENTFLDVVEMDKEQVGELFEFFLQKKMGYCVMAMRGNAMTTFLEGNLNEAEIEEMRVFRRSPYRHYATGTIHVEDRITMVRILVRNEEANAFEREILSLPFSQYFQISRRRQPRREGWTGFYFTDKQATLDLMEKRIVAHMENAEQIKVHRMRPRSVYYTPQRDATILLNRLKNLYMPIRLWPKS